MASPTGPQSGSARMTSSAPTAPAKSAAIALPDCGGQPRHRHEEVGLEPVVSDAEDRGFRVLVDGHDNLRVLHACQVLDSTRDARGDVELWRDDLASLTHLPVVRS